MLYEPTLLFVSFVSSHSPPFIYLQENKFLFQKNVFFGFNKASVIPLDQLKDDEFAEFAKRWLMGDVEVQPPDLVPKVYDAPSRVNMTIDKRPSKSINLQHQIIMKDASDGSDDGIELELQMLDIARSKMKSQLDSSCDESFLSRSSMNSQDSNRYMYTHSLMDRMSSVGERSTNISYPFWTPSIAKGKFSFVIFRVYRIE